MGGSRVIGTTAAAAFCLLGISAAAQSIVGTASATQTATVTVAAAGTVGSISVLTQGATGKDFAYVSGGTCTVGTAYAANAMCTVEYTFTPTRPGQRLGAIVLESNASPAAPLGTALLVGTGNGPLATFPGSTAVSAVGSGFSLPYDVAVDGAGDVFVADYFNNAVKEIEAGTGGNAADVVSSASTVVAVGSGFSYPYRVAVDGAGDVFVADFGNNAVKEIEAGTGGNAAGVVSSASTVVPVGSGFSFARGVAVDGAGDVFVADTNNSAVKEIEAGTGGNAAGAVSSSSTVVRVGSGFSNPFGVAVDGAGDVFVADTYNNAVKEIEAGTGGNVAGRVSSASTVVAVGSGFSEPPGVAVDGAGDVFVADFGNNAVKEIEAGTGGNAAGVVSSASTVVPVGSGFSELFGVAVDGFGHVFVGDQGNDAVKEIVLTTPPALSFSSTAVGATSSDSPKTVVVQNAGNADLAFSSIVLGGNANFTLDGTTTCSTGTALGESGLCNVAADFSPFEPGAQSSTVTLTDDSLSDSASTQVIDLGGTGTAATGTTAQTITFPQPATPAGPNTTATLTATSSSGLSVVYSVISGPATVSGSTVTYAGTGTVVLEADQYGNGTYAPASPVQVTVTVAITGPVGTASATQTATVKVATAGTIGSIAVLTQGATGKDFAYVSGGTCTVGTAYAANATCTVEYTFTPTRPGQRLGAIVLESNASPAAPLGTALLVATGNGPLATFPGSTAVSAVGSGFSYPSGVAVDGAGDVFVADTGNSAVYEIEAGTGGNAAGVVSSASTVVAVGSGFFYPEGVAVDGAGDVFVADSYNSAVKEIEAGTGGNAAGVISSASTVVRVGSGFSGLSGVAVDGAGDVLVADYGNSAVKEIEAGTGGNAAGVVSSASTVVRVGSGFSGPEGVAVDGAGDVFVADLGGSRVKEIVLTTPPSLSFVSTAVGATSSDSPKTVVVQNAGNAALSFPAPGSGFNPSLSANFSLGSTSTCPLVAASSGSAGTLASSGLCTEVLSFTPTMVGSVSGSLVFTDNSLNPGTATNQTVDLSGPGTQSTPVVTVQAATIVYGATPTTLTASIAYTGPTAPTGAVTFTVDSGSALTASCTGSSSPLSCTTSYATGSLTAGAAHTITVSIAADSNYVMASNTASLTVNQATPTITTPPTASAITYGQTLASSTLSNGVASTAGTFAWTTPTTAPGAGTASYSVTFTPTDTTDYTTATTTVSVKTNQATPTITTPPTASAITYGQTLASSMLSNGVASTAGTFAWTTPSTAPNAGTASYSVTFAPTDTTDYTTATTTVSVKTNQATPTITTPPTASAITYGQTLASSTLSNGVASTAGTFAWTTPSTAPGAGTASYSVTFTPADTTDYTTATTTVLVKTNQATPTITTPPTASAITYGQTLASSTLSNGVASTAGTFAWTTPTTAPGAGTASYSVTFTPTDTTDYTTATTTVSVKTNQARPTITTPPTASAITYGQTLASSTLSNGAASTAGSFVWTTPSTEPTAGTASYSVTFTPTDTTDYTTATTTVSVKTNQATLTITTPPTASALVYGQTLASSTLSNGVASTAGTFAWTTPSTVPTAGMALYSVTFIPSDPTDYTTAMTSVAVQVSTPDLVVTTPADDAGSASNCTPQTTPGKGTDPSCSLRDALLAAANAGAANITFDASKFAASQTITLANGILTLPANTTVTGPLSGSGAAAVDLVTVDGNNATEILTVAAGVTGTVSNLILQNGQGVNSQLGGAIYNAGTLTLNHVTVQNSEASGFSGGGGIYNDTGATLTLIDSTVTKSVSSYFGGSSGFGGGILNHGTLTLTASTLSSNAASLYGGNLYTDGPTATITDSTIANAGGTQNGGGIEADGGAVLLLDSTVSGNGAGNYSGIHVSSPGSLTATNSIIADNGGTGTTGNCVGCTLTGNDVVDVSAGLSALGDFGGSTQTMVPLPGSAAICAGAETLVPTGTTSDQRGRPLSGGGYCPAGTLDAGSVQTDYAMSFTTEPPSSVTAGQSFSAAVTLDESGLPFAPAVSIPLALASSDNGTLSGGTASTTNGVAAYSSLAVSAAGTGDQLIASVPLNPAIGANGLTLTANSTNFNVTAAVPTITWNTPAAITYGTALSTTQLDASSTVEGTFSYSPASGTIPGAGNDTLSVTFTPANTAEYATATASVTLQVNKGTPSISFAIPNHTYGDSPFTVTVTSNSTGAFTYKVVSGAATIAGSTVTITGTGAVTIEADEAADSNYNASSQQTSFTVSAATLTVTANNATRAYGAANPAFTGSVSGAANGDTFTESFATTANATSAPGSYPIVPSVTGANVGDYSVSVNNGTLTVAQAASITTVNASAASIDPNQSVTLTATVASTTTGTPTGSVTFYDNGTALQQVSLSNGSAPLTTLLSAGSMHTITATYSGDTDFLGGSATTSATVNVAPLNFSFSATAATSSQTVAPGATAIYTFNIAPLYGSYPGPVTFTISGLPAGASATFSPSTITAGAGPQTVTLTVQTAQPLARNDKGSPFGKDLPLMALLLLPLVSSRKRRRWNSRLLMLALLIAGLGGTTLLSGCGSGRNGFLREQPASYTLTVTATSGQEQHSQTVTLIVQ